MKHILVTLKWQQADAETYLHDTDPAWVVIKALKHNGQPVDALIPEPNGYVDELMVDDATLELMEASSKAVVIWSEDV